MHMTTKMRNLLKLLAAIVVSELAGIIGSVFTAPSISTWYATLTKPSWNPPSWIFGPVWTTLFLMMGIAAYLVMVKPSVAGKARKIALSVFGVQLALNTLWSVLFFGLQNPFLAFIEIVILWSAILATIILFYRISRPAAWLLAPYILWVSFASYLNFTIWRLNDTAATPTPVACTMEAKLCPDGSSVGRTGPKCEFAKCP